MRHLLSFNTLNHFIGNTGARQKEDKQLRRENERKLILHIITKNVKYDTVANLPISLVGSSFILPTSSTRFTMQIQNIYRLCSKLGSVVGFIRRKEKVRDSLHKFKFCPPYLFLPFHKIIQESKIQKQP